MFAKAISAPKIGGVSAAAMPLSAILRREHPSTQGTSGTCVVRLIDRRTGLTHKINGSPLVIFTRDPAVAVDELLEGRDRAIWEVRIDALEP